MIIDHGRVIAQGTLPELVDRTVGRYRMVTLRLDAPCDGAAAASVQGVQVDPDDSTLLRTKLTDVAAELPALLARVRDAGRTVEDVEVRGPSLQSVFIHLTGRELRE